MPLLALCACTTSTPAEPVASASDAGLLTPSTLPFAPAGPLAAPDPTRPGPYAVGVRTLLFTDDSRRTAGHTTARQLRSEVWYPAVKPSAGTPETYVLHDLLPPDLQATISTQALGSITTAAYRDAAVAVEGAPFPFIIFSHGKGGIRMQSTFYTVLLASHGYVVLAPDHEGDTLPELLQTQRIDVVSTLDAYLDRQQDLIFLLDQWSALPGSHPLFGLTNLSEVGLTGHSFGALTVLKVAGVDPRVKAVVAQTPAGYAITQADVPTPLEQYGIPIMLQAANLDRTLPPEPHTLSVWEHLSSPRYLLRLIRGGHFTYSDLCVLDVAAIDAAITLDVSNVLNDGCGPGNTPPAVAFPIINRSAVGFFNRYLRHSAGSAPYLSATAVEGQAPGEASFLSEP